MPMKQRIYDARREIAAAAPYVLEYGRARHRQGNLPQFPPALPRGARSQEGAQRFLGTGTSLCWATDLVCRLESPVIKTYCKSTSVDAL